MAARPRSKAGFDRADEPVGRDWLRQNARHTQAVGFFRAARHHHNGDVAGQRARGDLLLDDDAADDRQRKIEDDERGRVGIDAAKRIEAVADDLDVEAGERQRRPIEAPQIRIVLHDEDRLGRSHRLKNTGLYFRPQQNGSVFELDSHGDPATGFPHLLRARWLTTPSILTR